MIMPSESFQTPEAKNLHNSGILKIKDEIMKLFDQRQFSKASRLVISHIESVNEYVNSKEPWVLAKNESNHNKKSTLHEICSASLHSFRLLSIYLSPVMPELTSKVAKFFNEEEFLSFNKLIDEPSSINKYEHLLKRIEQNDIDLMIKKNTKI
jgi:methionyl-tRNA synthetase